MKTPANTGEWPAGTQGSGAGETAARPPAPPLLSVALELPPSVNHSHKNIRRRAKSGKLYTAKSPTVALLRWRLRAERAIGRAAHYQHWRRPEVEALVVVELQYFWPDRLRRDTHNRIKEIMDALQRAGVYHDDRQAIARELGFSIDRERPRVELRIFVEEPEP